MKIVSSLQILSLIGLSVLGFTTYTAVPTASAAATKVTICHATASDSNPFVSISVDDDSIDGIAPGNSDTDHNRDGHQNGEDIIPPGPWDLDGRNWTVENQAIYNNNCGNLIVVDPSIDPSPSGSASADPSAEPSVSPSPTPTPTPKDNNNNGGGSGDGLSDGLSSCPECTQAPKSDGQVLGAYAETGVAQDVIMNALGSLGGLMTAAGSVLYGNKKTKRNR